MRVAIVGSRTFDNYDLVVQTMDFLKDKVTTIVSGGAKGADTLGERYASENGIPITIYRPEWNKYGRSAEFKRNVTIVDNCDLLIAFWDGKSKETKHSIDLAIKANKIYRVVVP